MSDKPNLFQKHLQNAQNLTLTDQPASLPPLQPSASIASNPAAELISPQASLQAVIPTFQHVSMPPSQPVRRQLTTDIDQQIFDAIEDMMFFEKKKGNILLKQDIINTAMAEYLTKSGYLKK